MQLILTLRPRGGPNRDVEVHAPSGTTVGDISDLLHGAAGIGYSPGNSAADRSDSLRSGLWIGSRALPRHADLARVGLHSGCLVGVGEPAPRVRRAQSAVRLHVVSGPDAGRVEPIARGQWRIGRDPSCQVRLTDPDVSRQHAELSVRPSGVSVRDLDSSNGTSILSASAGPTSVDAGGQALPLDSYLTIGETTLCIAGSRTPPAASTSGADGRVLINRSPRLDPSPPSQLDLPADPSHERRAAIPWIAALIPALGGVALALFLRSPQFLAFGLLSPLVLLATALSDRVSGRKLRGRTRSAASRQRVAAAEARSVLAEDEATFRRHAHPDPATLFVTATTPDARLWERRRTDPDFLEVRLGLGTAPARAVTRIGADVLAPPDLPGVPAVVSMRDGPLGICGPRPLALPLAHWIIGQLAVLHSPADLRLAAALCDGEDGDWVWLRWLPHVRAPNGVLRIARSVDERHRLVSELSAMVDASRVSTTHPPSGGRPWTVVLVEGCSSTAEMSALVSDATRATAAGITFVHLDAEARRLPASCVTIAQLSGETGSRVRIRSRADGRDGLTPTTPGRGVPPTGPKPTGRGGGRLELGDPVADRVGEHWCDQVSRALAPLSDPGADQANDLPVSVRARDLYDLPDLTPKTIRARWDRARGRAATPVGIGLDGPVEIDLERDGPHTLIAGTTGAGKSELLQALVAGLALHCPPAELQFVLIDYKGGAAFGECARLPHAAGMVTDLDVHLTQRALESLEAELRRREKLFAHAGAIDLNAYRRSSDHTSEPVARIVLVVDEFASLAEELPDFVTGLVGVAQRGRSLGVHLILATQRPSGVVSAEIRANTALRIALRMTDPNDSSDVIGSDLAAHIDQHLPGRAVIRAAQSLFPVQIGRISTSADDVSSRVEVVPLDRWGSAVTTVVARSDVGTTDLAVLVNALRASWELDPVPLRRPWLDPLPARLDLATLAYRPAEDGATSQLDGPVGLATTIALGLVDRPREQDQAVFAVDLAEPSTMVFTGGPRSGRTSILRTAAVCAARQLRTDELHIYAIDCAGDGLELLVDLPHCGAVVTPASPTSITVLLSRLSSEIDRRRQPARRPRDQEPDPSAPALLLLLDGWEGFLAAVEDLDAGRSVDTFLRLLRDGAAAGLSVLITGDRATLSTRLSSAVQRRLVLRLSDPADYAVAGLSARGIPASMPPGRAVDTTSGNEIQMAIFDGDSSPAVQQQALGRIIAEAAGRERCEPSARLPFVVRALPTRVLLDELTDNRQPGRLVLGVGGDSGAPVTLRIGATGATGPGLRFLVAGPPRSGRSTFLRTIVVQLARMPHVVVVAAGSRSPVTALARELHIVVLDPNDDPGRAAAEIEALLTTDQPASLVIDDTELFTDNHVGERLAALVRSSPPALDAFATGRVDDLALTFGGLAAEIKRARTGILLQPGPGDGELFGLRLAFNRPLGPPGRGLLVAPDLIPDLAGSAASPLQVALT